MAQNPNGEVVGAHDAKTNLGQLLDRVERGERIIITRHGEPIARLVPFEDKVDQAQVLENIDGLEALSTRIARRGVELTQAELEASVDEGRP